MHTLQFLKLYLLACYSQLPVVTEHLVVSIMNVLCEDQEPGGGRILPATLLLKQELHAFHCDHYKSTMADPEERLEFTNKAQLFLYIAGDVVKDYENNIKLHFTQYLNRFLDVLYNKSEVMATKDEQARTQLFADLRAARDFILFQPKASNKRVRFTISAAKAYFTKKNEVNAKLFQHYEQRAYRVLKWRAFVNRRRSEDRMVNRFRKRFGGKDEVVLG